MNADTKKWADKAEGDFEGASTLVRHRSSRMAGSSYLLSMSAGRREIPEGVLS